jgi:hypothetical protein
MRAFWHDEASSLFFFKMLRTCLKTQTRKGHNQTCSGFLLALLTSFRSGTLLERPKKLQNSEKPNFSFRTYRKSFFDCEEHFILLILFFNCGWLAAASRKSSFNWLHSYSTSACLSLNYRHWFRRTGKILCTCICVYVNISCNHTHRKCSFDGDLSRVSKTTMLG